MSNEDPDEDKVSWWKGICSIRTRIDYYRIHTVKVMLHNKRDVAERKLKAELRKVRFSYNVWNGFASGFIISFFVGFITLLAGKVLPENIKNYIGLWAIAIIFIIIVVVQTIFLRTANTSYEKMKLVEETLKNLDDSKEFDEISIREHSNTKRISIFNSISHSIRFNR